MQVQSLNSSPYYSAALSLGLSYYASRFLPITFNDTLIISAIQQTALYFFGSSPQVSSFFKTSCKLIFIDLPLVLSVAFLIENYLRPNTLEEYFIHTYLLGLKTPGFEIREMFSLDVPRWALYELAVSNVLGKFITFTVLWWHQPTSKSSIETPSAGSISTTNPISSSSAPK